MKNIKPNNIEQLCEKINQLELCKMISTEDSVRVEFPPPVNITLHYNLQRDPQKHQILFFIKADRFVFDGDKTDLNDIFGIIVAALLKCTKFDCSVVTRNVSDNFVGLDTEVDYVVLIPNQIHTDLYYEQGSIKAIEALESLITELLLFQNYLWKILGCPCDDCKAESEFDDFLSYEIPKDLKSKLIRLKITGKRENHLSRKHPTWDYYCNFSKGISVVKSASLVKLLRNLIKSSNQKYFQSDKCLFVQTEYVKNAIPISEIDSTHKILDTLEGTSLHEIQLIPFENSFVALGNNVLLVRGCDSSFNTYRKFKDIIEKRNIAENRFLFPPSKFVWSTKIDAGGFEDLCLELLKKERYTKWARKAGATNEGDNGRDLIAEIVEIKDVKFSEDGKAIIDSEIRKIVVQCKAYTRSIGKADVKDIRDTIEFHNSNGFLLISAQGISNPLIRHLEILKDKNSFYMDWWTKNEIEDRLKLHPDILVKYSSMVKQMEYKVEKA